MQEACPILHATRTWLPKTQTWLFSQVHFQQQFGANAHVICENLENVCDFSVPNIHPAPRTNSILKYVPRELRRTLGIPNLTGGYFKVIQDLAPTVLHSHFGPVGWDHIGITEELGTKHVVSFYGMDVGWLPTRNGAWLDRYQRLFQSACVIVCEGPFMADCIKSLGCPRHKILVHPIGINLDNIEFRPRRKMAGEPLRILIASSYREKKGIPFAVMAIAGLKGRLPFEVTIIGDSAGDKEGDREKKIILQLIDKHKLQDKVRLLGFQPYSVIFNEAYKHHIFLHPSVTSIDRDTEGGAPVVIIEMLATGMLVVATKHCDIPNIFAPPLLPLLANERDVEQLTEILAFIDSTPEAWEPLAVAARSFVESNNSITRQTQRMLSIYTKLSTHGVVDLDHI